MHDTIFEDLFVLELANNHWGKLDRGLKIIDTYVPIVRSHHVRAAIKLQLRDVDQFIHADFQKNEEIRYIKKTRATKLLWEEHAILVKAIKQGGCIPMATPFDEKSVELCVEFELPIIKIASSSINDWALVNKIASTKKAVIVSTGGASLKDMDDIVTFFENKKIPLALNHCVSIYPSEDGELELNQIDFLKNRYPGHVIGFSTHEYQDWSVSLIIAYAKGARTFERHIDIDYADVAVSPYCSLPHQIDAWFKAYNRTVLMCGGPGTEKRVTPQKESSYLKTLVRGMYAKRDLPRGHRFTLQNKEVDTYAAIPLQPNQVPCRKIMTDEILLRSIKQDTPIMYADIGATTLP